MRPILILILVFVAVPFVMATPKAIYSDWQHSLDTWESGSDLFFMSFEPVYRCFNGTYELDADFLLPTDGGDPSFERILLSKNDKSFIIPLYSCKEDEYFRYCFDGVDCKTRIKYEGGEQYPAVKISVWKLEPELKITRTFSTTSPEFGQDVDVSVTVKNDGNEEATNIMYVDLYPKTFKLLRSDALLADGNKVVWNGWVRPGEEKTFYYIIKPIAYTEFTTKANITFRYGDKKASLQSSASTIKVQTPYEIKLNTPTTMGVNELSTVVLTITNNQERDTISVDNLRITLPPEFTFDSFAGATRIDMITYDLVRTENEYTWHGVLGPGNSRTFYIRYRAMVKGSFPITYASSITSSKELFEETKTNTVKVDVQELIPTVRVTPEVVKAGTPAKLVVYLDNGNKTAYANFRADLRSELFGSLSFTEPEIRKGERLNLLAQEFTTPQVSQNTTFLIILEGTYITFTGTQYEFHKEATLKVTTDTPAKPYSFAITHALSKQIAKPGENITIITQVKNQANVDARGVRIEDRFSSPVPIVAGITTKDMDLSTQESRQAYVYKIQIPTDFLEDTLNVTTFLSIEDVTLEKMSTITVEHPVITDTGDDEPGTSENSTDTNNGEEQIVKKGIFTKIWEFFKNIFN
ncbi:MAG: hypothetical protein ABIA93_03335 [Candidatus Woesearchaeota archaeon]